MIEKANVSRNEPHAGTDLIIQAELVLADSRRHAASVRRMLELLDEQRTQYRLRLGPDA